MQKPHLLVDQLSYSHISISERDLLALMTPVGGKITIRQSHMIATLMLLQLLIAFVLMAFMMVA